MEAFNYSRFRVKPRAKRIADIQVPYLVRSESFCSDVTVCSPTIFNKWRDGDLDNTAKCKADSIMSLN